ncbi:MAG: spermidine/putrescine ABC transporter substrate-binding protein [Anaerolineae bacterium]
MRKGFLVALVALFALALVLPVAAQDATPAAYEPWVCPDGFQGQTLSVYNWTTYVAENTIANFEAACGVSVIYDVYESNEALLARLSQGNPGYDIIVPTDFMVTQMADLGLLEPLDHSLIPNIANVAETFIDPPFDPGNTYSLPYQWGTIGFGYNITKTGEPITSWAQLFAYDGPVAWLEDPRGMLGNALSLEGFDPNSQDPAEIEQARDYLIQNGGNVVAIAADDGQVRLEQGEVDITVEYSGDIFQLIADCACEDYGYAIPEEGAQLWTDNLAIPAGAPNPALAHAFIDYILSPIAGADISNYTAYGSPLNQDILNALIDPALLENPGIYPSEETRSRLFFIQAAPDAETFYNDAWDIVKVAVSR